MSWVMADRVGQSEHHYSAGFFFPPRIISAQQCKALLNNSHLCLLGSVHSYNRTESGYLLMLKMLILSLPWSEVIK